MHLQDVEPGDPFRTEIRPHGALFWFWVMHEIVSQGLSYENAVSQAPMDARRRVVSLSSWPGVSHGCPARFLLGGCPPVHGIDILGAGR